MKVILLNDVKGTGKKYDIKSVSDGYAMNFLLPNKLATRATAERIKKIEEIKRDTSEEIRAQEDLLQRNLASLKNVCLEMVEKASEKGGLFEGITAKTIVRELKKQVCIDISEESIVLEKPIKEVGNHTIEVREGEFKTSFKLFISAK